MLNAGVTPLVPEVGSVGASGDLAPLAHAALVLIGEGQALGPDGVTPIPGAEALRKAGLKPIALGAKEGLALINGTHLMASRAALILTDVERVFDAALVATAMSIDAARGTDAALDERAHAIRRQPGQMRVAARLRNMLASSEIVRSHVTNDPRVQDPYSFRCSPQALGAALDAIEYVRGAVERELDAVTDNPLVFETDEPEVRTVVSAGNFHGLPLALPLDTLAIALVPIAGMAERRVFNLLAASDPEAQLRPHLSPSPGLHSGLMITQYTAAACVNEMIGLATPASVSNIPTCAGMEDYNSFGPRSAAKARRSVELCARVIAIEMICAAEGIEYHRPLKSGEVVERAHALIRTVAPRLVADRPPSPDIEAVARLIFQGRFGE
jgi:histidine ammonia-lyase